MGGAERVCLTLAASFLDRGYGVDLVATQCGGQLLADVPPAADVTVLGAPKLRNAVVPLATHFRRRRPDAVLAHMWPLTVASLAAHRLARLSGRIVLCDHGMLSIAYSDRGRLHRLILKSTLRAYAMAGAYIAVSSGAADDLARLSGLPRSRIHVIHNPVEIGSDERVAPLWGGWQGPRILSVGRFKTAKNHRLLIDAFAKLVRRQDARLMILGDGELRHQIEKQVQFLGLQGKVILPGFAAPGPYYRSADLFVMSSDHEGFGIALVEALQCGLPVVSTDCPAGPAEILDNGRYGELVPCGDADALAVAMERSLVLHHDHVSLQRRGNEYRPSVAVDKYLNVLFPQSST